MTTPEAFIWRGAFAMLVGGALVGFGVAAGAVFLWLLGAVLAGIGQLVMLVGLIGIGVRAGILSAREHDEGPRPPEGGRGPKPQGISGG